MHRRNMIAPPKRPSRNKDTTSDALYEPRSRDRNSRDRFMTILPAGELAGLPSLLESMIALA
jgi:hypothetical protein